MLYVSPRHSLPPVPPQGYRFAMPHSILMMHHPSGASRGQASEMHIESRELVRMRDYLSLLVSNSTGQPYDRVRQGLAGLGVMRRSNGVGNAWLWGGHGGGCGVGERSLAGYVALCETVPRCLEPANGPLFLRPVCQGGSTQGSQLGCCWHHCNLG